MKYTKEQYETHQLAEECVEEGIKSLRQGDLKNAELMVRRGKVLYEELKDLGKKASTSNALSIIYDEMGNDSMSMECLLDALDDGLAIDDYEIVAKVYNNLGSKFLYLKSYERALYYFKGAIDMHGKAMEQNPEAARECQAFELIMNLNLSSTYCHMGDVAKARSYYKVAKALSEHPNCESVFFTFQCFEGLTLWRMGDKDAAKELVDSIIEGARATKYAPDYLEVTSDIIELLREMNDFERWESVLILIDEKLEDNLGVHVRTELVRRWVEFYKESGNLKKYRELCVDYYELSKEKVSYDYEKKANSIELKAEIRRAMHQKELSDSIVYLDTLTGIGNRNKMLKDSKTYIEESVKKRSTITIGLLDIDFFKECNDTYGHIKGDECLKTVAEILNEAVGDAGCIYRYGGDEFLLLLPNVKEEKILEIGKTIKEKLAEKNIPNERSPIIPQITISQGYTTAVADEGDTIEYLVNLADRVLYSVKRRGRNDYKYAGYLEAVSKM